MSRYNEYTPKEMNRRWNLEEQQKRAELTGDWENQQQTTVPSDGLPVSVLKGLEKMSTRLFVFL